MIHWPRELEERLWGMMELMGDDLLVTLVLTPCIWILHSCRSLGLLHVDFPRLREPATGPEQIVRSEERTSVSMLELEAATLVSWGYSLD